MKRRGNYFHKILFFGIFILIAVYFVSGTTILTDVQGTFDKLVASNLTVSDNLTVSGNLTAEIGRTVSFTIAGLGSSKTSREQADYVCDGTADEEQIEAAIAALPTEGGEIKLLEGDFSISTPITINRGDVVLSGLGIATKLLLADNADCDLIEADVASDVPAFILRWMLLDGNKASNSAGRGFYDGVGAGEITDFHMKEVQVINTAGNAIELDNCWGAVLDTVIIEYCGSNGIVFNTGARDGRIKNSKIMDNAGHSIFINGASNCQITGNYIEPDANKYGIYVTGNVAVITDNTIFDGVNAGAKGIYIASSYNVINNNAIDGSGGAMDTALEFTSGANYNLAIGNVIYGGGATILTDLGTGNVIIGRLDPTANSDFIMKGADVNITEDLSVSGNVTINNSLAIGNSNNQGNITFYSPDGTLWNCGVDNSGAFNCS